MSSLGGARILVVDDELGFREIVGDEFSIVGAEVFFAESGNEALKILEQQKIDIVISDTRMPDGDGLYLLDEVRLRFGRNPIFILMSGFSDVSEQEILARGAHGVCIKPCDMDQLIENVKKFWGSKIS